MVVTARTQTCVFINVPTWSDLPVLRSGAVLQHVLHLQELVRPVAADDGEAEAHGALPQRRPHQDAFQLGRVPREVGFLRVCAEMRYGFEDKKKNHYRDREGTFSRLSV